MLHGSLRAFPTFFLYILKRIKKQAEEVSERFMLRRVCFVHCFVNFLMVAVYLNLQHCEQRFLKYALLNRFGFFFVACDSNFCSPTRK